MAPKVEIIYYVALYRKSLPTPELVYAMALQLISGGDYDLSFSF